MDMMLTQGERLRKLHVEILCTAQMILEKAIEAGGILREVKIALPHGEFTAWVELNAGFSMRTAQRYMKIHENREEIKNDSVSLLTDAHRLLTVPKTEQSTDKAKELERLEQIIENGLRQLTDAGYEDIGPAMMCYVNNGCTCPARGIDE